MSRIILEKRSEKVRFHLEKHNIQKAPTLRVSAVLDVSFSAKPFYESGAIQETIERLIPIAMRFDDDGSQDMWAFDSQFSRLAPATIDNFEGYVQREVLGNPRLNKWSGTRYAGPIRDILEFYFPGSSAPAAAPVQSSGFFASLFGKKPSAPVITQPQDTQEQGLPAMVLFTTDGATQDRDETTRLLRASVNKPIYWQMVGIGDPSEFDFLQDLADELPNVGFVNLASLKLTDDEIYSKLLSEELCTWVKQF